LASTSSFVSLENSTFASAKNAQGNGSKIYKQQQKHLKKALLKQFLYFLANLQARHSSGCLKGAVDRSPQSRSGSSNEN